MRSWMRFWVLIGLSHTGEVVYIVPFVMRQKKMKRPSTRTTQLAGQLLKLLQRLLMPTAEENSNRSTFGRRCETHKAPNLLHFYLVTNEFNISQ